MKKLPASVSVNRPLAVTFVFIHKCEQTNKNNLKNKKITHTNFLKLADWVELNGTALNITGCGEKKKGRDTEKQRGCLAPCKLMSKYPDAT